MKTATPQNQNKEYTDNQIQWLKNYLDSKFDSVTRAVDKVEATNARAVDKVEATNASAINKVENNYGDYRAQQNEWRGQIKDQSATFVTRSELWFAVITVLSLALAIAGFIFK